MRAARPDRSTIRFVLPALAALVALVAFGAAALRDRDPANRVPRVGGPADRSVGPAPPPWRSLRLLWRTPVSQSDYIDRRIQDIQLADGRLYYVGETEVGCVTADSGTLLWRRSLVPPGDADEAWRQERSRLLAVGDGKVLLSETYVYSPPPRPPYLVLAFDAPTGRPLWKRSERRRLYGRPVPSSGSVLVSASDGAVLALRTSDGTLAWQRRLTKASGGEINAPELHVRAEGPIGVAQLGGDELVGFRVSDGRELWRMRGSLPSGGTGPSEGFSVRGGAAYATLRLSEFARIDLASGKRLWGRSCPGGVTQSSVSEVVGQRVVTQVYQTLVALDQRTGATQWFRRSEDYEQIMPGAGNGPDPVLVLKMRTEPRIAGEPKPTVSVPDLDTLVALDPATGREVWRWQPYEGIQVERVIPLGDRLLISDASALFCFGPGEPESLPTDVGERRRLAHQTVDFTFRDHYPHHAADGVTSFPPSTSEKNEGRLRLLRLGKDSVPALLGYVREVLERDERRLLSPEDLERRRQSPFVPEPGSALAVLADIGEPDAAAELISLAGALENPLSMDRLAEALVQYGDARAAPFLFRYARTEDGDPMLHQATLYFVCRAGDVAGLDQREVTAYLVTQLAREKGPRWLRQFARFELLNDRGSSARRAALAAFRQERTARLLPGPGEDVGNRSRLWGPFSFGGRSAVRDERGVYWAVCTSGYLGEEEIHLWLAQSTDGKKWVRPAFVQRLPPELRWMRQLKQSYRAGELLLDVAEDRWQGQELVPARRLLLIPASRRLVIPIADAYRDTDGDGLPDRLERQLGTDPQKADTNGNGIPDATDKSPACRPHALTDEEGIYQAVLEGLCQLGRTAPADPSAYERFSAVPSSLGRSREPLLLPIPPASKGIEILGHPGVLVTQKKPSSSGNFPTRNPWGFSRFTPPNVGIEGTWQKRALRPWWQGPPGDPFDPSANRMEPPALSFREFFPYELSADRTRARVGWLEEYQGTRQSSDTFDVEVRKIGERWIPVECRQVQNTFGFGMETATVPIRPMRGVHP